MNTTKSLLAMSELEIVTLIKRLLMGYDAIVGNIAAQTTLSYLKLTGMTLNEWRSKLTLGDVPVKARLENWSFDSHHVEHDFEKCLGRSVKYGNQGGETTRILGYDMATYRVLTMSGSVYELERPVVVVPVRVMSADDYSWNHEAAVAYLETREQDKHKFTTELKWQTHPEGHSIITEIYGMRVVHYFRTETVAHCGWGESFKEMSEFPGNFDTERFKTFECFVAYILAKYW